MSTRKIKVSHGYLKVLVSPIPCHFVSLEFWKRNVKHFKFWVIAKTKLSNVTHSKNYTDIMTFLLVVI